MFKALHGTVLYIVVGLMGILPFFDVSIAWRPEYSPVAGCWAIAAALLLVWSLRADTRVEEADAELGRMIVEGHVRTHGISPGDARLYELVADPDTTKLVESRDLLARRFLELAKAAPEPHAEGAVAAN